MQIQNFARNYTALRTVALVAIGIVVLSNGIWAYLLLSLRANQMNKVYVLTPVGTFPATLQDDVQPSVYEARNHVKQFMNFMFAHDERSYKRHVEAALHLIEKSEGMALYKDFEKGGVQDNYVKYGSRSFFTTENIEVDMSQEPYQGSMYGQQLIMYEDHQKKLPIGATFSLERTRRSDTNPHGLLIKDWKFVDYRALANQKGGTP